MHPQVQAVVGAAVAVVAADFGGFCGGMCRHTASGGLCSG